MCIDFSLSISAPKDALVEVHRLLIHFDFDNSLYEYWFEMLALETASKLAKTQLKTL